MASLDVFVSIIVNLFPLAMFAIPIPFIRKKKFAGIYNRLFYGLCVFFLVYWVLPVLFQFNFVQLPVSPEDDGSVGLGIEYLVIRSFSMFALYLQYPLRILPFIFVLSPFLSSYLLIRRIKKESDESLSEIVSKLNYDYIQSPRKFIRNALSSRDWAREKEIFRGFLILLPISLYLLVVILDIANVEGEALYLLNVEEGSTALGWFIEILFVYIATFLFAFQLLKTSKIYYSGKAIGAQIQDQFFSSLREVGTPIAVLSVILFIAQKTQIFLLIIYFFSYFLMAAYIFITLLRIFEPVSIYILFKIINYVKKRKEKVKVKEFQGTSTVFLMGLLAGSLATGIFLFFGLIYGILINAIPNGQNFQQEALLGNVPTLEMAMFTDVLIIVNTLQSAFIILVLAYFFKMLLERFQIRAKVYWIYTGVLLLMTLLLSISSIFTFNSPLLIEADVSWITGSPIMHNLFGFEFYTMRSAFLTADLSSTNLVLYVLAVPFLYLRAFVNFSLWALFYTLLNKEFRSKRIQLSKFDKFRGSKIVETEKSEDEENKSEDEMERLIEKITYIALNVGIPYEIFSAYKLHYKEYLVAEPVNKPESSMNINLSDEHLWLLDEIRNNRGLTLGELFLLNVPTDRFQISDSTDSHEYLKWIYTLLNYLYRARLIRWWVEEFSYTYERAKLDGLYILYNDGRDLLYYNFNVDEKPVEPALVSGMFSAITSFVQETTKSKGRLSSIESGSKKVILEYSEDVPVFAAIFADRETSEVRDALRELLRRFCDKHKEILKNWNGNMKYFDEDQALVEEIFGEFL